MLVSTNYTLMDLSDHEKALYNLLCLCYIINSGIFLVKRGMACCRSACRTAFYTHDRQHECGCFL